MLRVSFKLIGRVALCVGAILPVFPVYAGAGYTSMGIITDYNPREFGVDVALPSGGNLVPCTLGGQYRLKADAANYQVLAAFLLSQFAQQKPVSVYTNNCDFDGASIIVAAKAK